MMNVSIIIPAYNAQETIVATLKSVLAQSCSTWEAIIVDDGSTDETATIAARFARQDPRIQVMRQVQMGVSAARNSGIRMARYGWLLFLDADDWLAPQYLEKMTGRLAEDRSLDVVHCGWAWVAPDGTLLPAHFAPDKPDLFQEFARNILIAIHACIVRKSLVEVVGCFDPQQKIGEDWDLFQRVARTGARFGAVQELLAFYRMRENAASADGLAFGPEGIRLLNLGHSADSRVANPHPAHADGEPAEELPGLQLYWICWAAGLVLGRGVDARPLLAHIDGVIAPDIEPWNIANNLFDALTVPSCRTHTLTWQLWPAVTTQLNHFLGELEASVQVPNLARRVLTILERKVISEASSSCSYPLIIGSTLAVCIEITKPIGNIIAPQGTARLYAVVTMEGATLGSVELPICDGLVTAAVLQDAIADEYAWPILGRFFEHSLYPHLQIQQTIDGASLWREHLSLSTDLPEPGPAFWTIVHDQVGWTLFLQEFWSCPYHSAAFFYDNDAPSPYEPSLCHLQYEDFVSLEVSEPLPNIETYARVVRVAFYVGRSLLAVVQVPVENHFVSAQKLRVALTMSGAMELCRVAVREGLLSRRLTDPESLHARLASNASVRREKRRGADTLRLTLSLAADGAQLGVITGPRFLPGTEEFLHQISALEINSLVVARWSHQMLGTSASRRSKLPSAASQMILCAAESEGTPVIQIPQRDEAPKQVIYAPEFVWNPASVLANSDVQHGRERTVTASHYGRDHFETLFALRPDPWKYTSPYEQTKYEQTLAFLPSQRPKRAIEIGCAEGHFTVQLATLVNSLLAVDISDIALRRAAERCAALPNVSFAHFDLCKDLLPGRFDLIVCSEMLYFMGEQEDLRVVAQKLADALEPGGYLLVAHANLIVDEPERTGFNWNLPFGAKVIGTTLAAIDSLQLIKELRVPLYRIQLFQRKERRWLPHFHRAPQISEIEQPTPIPPEVIDTIIWQGSTTPPSEAPQPVTTRQLPILMYHRIAPIGAQRTARYRVSPADFEKQLRFLKDSGYYTIRLEEWQSAVQAKKALSGQAILITFDDGYQDFLTYAWPLLERYGFSATVFLVGDQIGGVNEWDRLSGELAPLLSWQEIHLLQSKGVEFGSHSMSHSPLTGLDLEQVVHEAICSRMTLSRGLGKPVTAFAYPYGDVDRVVQHLVGACGYTFAFSCRAGLAKFTNNLLALPRIEITGSDSLSGFVAKLARP
jgi:peptidoglycan/xylan/chitin deacetylase (PgdA/CDA1 family)/2-polyprenyl-3-methyl-5-hydroxy-6-metoxy-1,4-benzoquinol methylase